MASAEENRRYAESLIGPLDRSTYGKEFDVAKQVNKTKWDVLQNQFANLKAQLESQRASADTAYQQGLTGVMENDFSRGQSANADIVQRGLANSGVRDIIGQQLTRVKGQEVNKLLSSLSGVMGENAKGLSNANNTVYGNERNLTAELGNALGRVSNADLNAQGQYNTAASNIAGSKEARDMENALAAAQRARSGGGGGGSSKSKEESDLDAFYKQAAMAEVLMAEGKSPAWKANMLKIHFGVNNAKSMVDTFTTDRKTQKVDLYKYLDKRPVGIRNNSPSIPINDIKNINVIPGQPQIVRTMGPSSTIQPLNNMVPKESSNTLLDIYNGLRTTGGGGVNYRKEREESQKEVEDFIKMLNSL